MCGSVAIFSISIHVSINGCFLYVLKLYEGNLCGNTIMANGSIPSIMSHLLLPDKQPMAIFYVKSSTNPCSTVISSVIIAVGMNNLLFVARSHQLQEHKSKNFDHYCGLPVGFRFVCFGSLKKTSLDSQNNTQ